MMTIIMIIIIINYCMLNKLLIENSSKIIYPRDFGISKVHNLKYTA